MVDRAGVVPQLLGAAVGIVLGSALLFFVVGMLRDDAPPEPEVVAEEDPSESAPGTDDGADPSPSDVASPEPEPSPTGAATEDPGPEPSPSPTEPLEEVDPASVSVQVLDAVGGDGSAARAVADELREAGFDVIVVNRAGRGYDVTTVFWSSGQAAGGQQVAAALDAGQAEETPEEVQLSDSVDVHVVVGSDRA